MADCNAASAASAAAFASVAIALYWARVMVAMLGFPAMNDEMVTIPRARFERLRQLACLIEQLAPEADITRAVMRSVAAGDLDPLPAPVADEVRNRVMSEWQPWRAIPDDDPEHEDDP